MFEYAQYFCYTNGTGDKWEKIVEGFRVVILHGYFSNLSILSNLSNFCSSYFGGKKKKMHFCPNQVLSCPILMSHQTRYKFLYYIALRTEHNTKILNFDKTIHESIWYVQNVVDPFSMLFLWFTNVAFVAFADKRRGCVHCFVLLWHTSTKESGRVYSKGHT